MVTCKKCGFENEDGKKFCSECGSSLAEAEVTVAVAQEETVQAEVVQEEVTQQPIQQQPIQAEPVAQPVQQQPVQQQPVQQQPVYTAPIVNGTAQPVPEAPINYTEADQKSKMVAGLLGIFLGGFGAGRFYLGYTNLGIFQLVASVLTCGAGGLWGLIDGIMILTGSVKVDGKGIPLKD